MNAQPELDQIVSMFDQTLVEFHDAVWSLTELYDDMKEPDETTLAKHIGYVANRREKLIMCARGAYEHFNYVNLLASIPMLHMHGGIC